MASEPKPISESDADPIPADAADTQVTGDSGSVSPMVDAAASGASHSFDQEFRRLNSVLANHGPHVLRSPDVDAPHDAKELEGWMRRVDKTLSRLRKRRSKRGN